MNTVVNNVDAFTISGGINFVGNTFNGSNINNTQGLFNSDAHAQSVIVKSVLDSLKFPEEWHRFEKIHEPFPGTYAWILKPQYFPPSLKNRVSPTGFLHWLRNDGTIFWISGNAGSGKSTLMKFILDHPDLKDSLEAWAGPDRALVVPCYFFWRAGTSIQRDLSGLMRSLLRQVIQKLPEFPVDLLTGESERGNTWTYERTSNTLKSALRRGTSTAFCFFIDGLDEFCGSEEDQDAMIAFVLEISSFENVKICVSSRPEVFYSDTFQDAESIKLHFLTEADMRKAAEGRLRKQKTFRLQAAEDSKLATQVVSTLCAKAQGVFLWLHLAVEDVIRGLKRHETLEESISRIQSLSSNLNDLFADLLERIDWHHRQRSARIAQVLMIFNHETNSWSESRSSDQRHLHVCVMFAAAYALPELFQPLLRSSVNSSEQLNNTSDQTFRHLLRFDASIQEQSMGLIESDSRRSTRCGAQKLTDCACGLEDGFSGSGFELFSLVTHFQNFRVDFVHRSAYDFFASETTGVTWLKQNAPTTGRGAYDCVTALRIVYQTSLRGFHTAAMAAPPQLDATLELLPALEPEEGKSIVTEIAFRYWRPFALFDTWAMAMASILPAEHMSVDELSPFLVHVYESFSKVIDQDAKEVDDACTSLVLMLDKLEVLLQRVNATSHPADISVGRDTDTEASGDVRHWWEWLRRHMLTIEKARVRSWHRFATSVATKDTRKRQESFVRMLASNTACILPSGTVGGIHIANMLRLGSCLKDVLPNRGALATLHAVSSNEFELDDWSLQCLLAVLDLAHDCEPLTRKTILDAIKQFLSEDVCQDVAFRMLSWLAGDASTRCYVWVETSLRTFVEDVLVLDGHTRADLLNTPRIKEASKTIVYRTYTVSPSADPERIGWQFENPGHDMTLLDDGDAAEAERLICDVIRSRHLTHWKNVNDRDPADALHEFSCRKIQSGNGMLQGGRCGDGALVDTNVISQRLRAAMQRRSDAVIASSIFS